MTVTVTVKRNPAVLVCALAGHKPVTVTHMVTVMVMVTVTVTVTEYLF